MTARTASCAAFSLVLLAGAAAADQTFDLRALAGRDPAVGERTRVVEEDATKQTMAGQTVMEMRSSATYVDEVQEVGADGKPTRVLRTYEAFVDREGEPVDVTGVKVLLTRDEAAQRHAFAAAEGSAPLPEALRSDLEGTTRDRSEREAKGRTEAQIFGAFLPAEPQPVGGTWTIDPARLVEALGLAPGDVDVGASKGSGKLVGLEQADGREWVTVAVSVQLVLARMQGQQLPSPAPMDMKLTLRLPAAGDVPDGETHMTHHLPLELPGPQGMVPVVIDGERRERRTTAR
ncbi:MAG: hypothetical protein KF878_14015 [Planctomycetes bacterium]|nr:hypothetical protein [Planctomycetota bacterium]